MPSIYLGVSLGPNGQSKQNGQLTILIAVLFYWWNNEFATATSHPDNIR